MGKRAEQLQRRAAERVTGQYACSRCGQTKPASEYPPSTLAKGQYHCRECRAAHKRRKRVELAAAGLSSRGMPYVLVPEEKEQRARERERTMREDRQRQAADREARRLERKGAPSLACWTCGEEKPRSEFYATQLTRCRSCHAERDRRRIRRHVDGLTDHYLRRLLTKHSGLVAADVPRPLLEAKRAQMAIQRHLGMRSADILVRFYSKTVRRGECLVWTGSVLRKGGVPLFCYLPSGGGTRRQVYAHRWLWEQVRGDIGNMDLWRTCSTPLCIASQHREPRPKQQKLARSEQ